MSSTSLGMAHTSSRSAILDVIRAAGTISRVELTHATGLTGATISTVVRRLMNEGLVVEAGRAESTGGKPRRLLQLDPNARYAVGVHLDHAGITYVLANLGGAIVARWRKSGAGSDDPQEVVARMVGEIDAMVTRAGVDHARVLGVGVVSPGPITASVGMVLAPPIMQRWADYPLGDALEEAVGVPVLLDNDATAAAIGEYWAGGIEKTSAFAALYMGTGIGAGVLVNGAVYRGSSSNAGEIGHICVDVDGPECWCGSRGCVEALAGPAAVVAAAQAEGLDLGQPDRTVAEQFAAVARSALRGEAAAQAILQRSARYIGVAAQTLANIMDVDLVALTGPSFAVAGSIYLPTVEEQLGRSFFARGSHAVRVTISSNASEAAAVGAAALVLQSELAPRQSGLRLPAPLLAESDGAKPSAALG
ncbi:ROK family transcriptional regulator [Cellulomonas chengniuliangii]|uniref:ROK family transcriptional regulator n=1 Tax=Cellulomonas chengniuliangii TaxID=2968084 RepID=A0ABY5L0G6_9CELL|nr:ROK family transcriptional regulator [Cellulomonas chengniuliangii]MCC2309835.1 ROK family transcriptional regulator [Cellulomonas chengniuliangii]MCC2318093.1 ROK family transcriptional regulator [Cellulomonas chengniuliangii]UUI76280.1 ROK family transcriptional regulator [Cellulomonas chengniuliangii]